MPLHSKAQMRKLFALEEKGQLKKGTAIEFAHATPNISKLPEYVHEAKKRALKRIAR